MKEIELSQEQTTIVDDEDFEYLNQWKWFAVWSECIKGYYVMRSQHIGVINGKRKQGSVYMHRLIAKAPKGKVVDHINHNTLDNRKENLRIASYYQNQQNRKKRGTSKYPGVSWDVPKQKWRPRIKVNGIHKSLGYFDDEREAAKAYEKACRELIGEELVCKEKGAA